MSKQRLLRSFLFYYYQEDFPEWFTFLVEEQLDKILSVEKVLSKGEKVLKENLIIRQTFLLLGRESGLNLLKNVYSENNLLRWKQTGEQLCTRYSLVRIPLANPKEKIRRRGYRESSSNNHNTKSQEGEVKMSIEARDLEEVKRRIQLKQAMLFEQRLDRYLEIEIQAADPQKQKEIFNSLLEADLTLDSVESPTIEKLLSERRKENES